MTALALGLALFLGAHSVSIVAPAGRARIVARIGLLPWQGLFGLVALAGFVLIIRGYGAASQEAALLYVPPVWLGHLALLLMLFVFPLLLATYLPGRISRTARHPMLLATQIWALAHLLANGSQADALLFGAFLAWAVADRISLQWRAPLPVPGAPASGRNDWIAVTVGLALYAAFMLGGHRWLIGVAPIG